MIDLVALLSDGLHEIFEQSNASVLVILHYFGMLENDIDNEVQQMRRGKQCCVWILFKCDLKDVDKSIDAVPNSFGVDLVDLV